MTADVRQLGDLTSIGRAMLKDFALLGIDSVTALAQCDAQELYDRLCTLTKARQDPCVLDTFACAIAQARDPQLPAAQRQWWYWSRVRKAAQRTGVLLLAGLSSLSALAASNDPVSIFTSLQKCKTTFRQGYYTESRCPSYGEYTVAYNKGSHRSWLIIRRKEWRWDSRNELSKMIPGTLQHVTAQQLEWRLPATGAAEPNALIAKVAAQDGAPLRDTEWLVVLRLRPEGVAVAGVMKADDPNALQKARDVADAGH